MISNSAIQLLKTTIEKRLEENTQRRIILEIEENFSMSQIQEIMGHVDSIRTEIAVTEKAIALDDFFLSEMKALQQVVSSEQSDNTALNVVHSETKRVHRKAILVDRIAVRFDEDEVQPMIVSMKVVKVNSLKLIVMSDLHNCCIKCCYIKKAVEHDERNHDSNIRASHQSLQDMPRDKSRLQLQGRPGGLAQTSSDVLIVVISDKKLITFFGLLPDLSVDRYVRTEKEYGGIAFVNDVFVAAAPWSEPSSVDVLDLRGQILKSYSLGPSGEPYFEVPWFVTSTPEGHAIVSDTYDKNVTSLNRELEVVFSFKPDYTATIPRETAVDDKGDVYICDSGRNKVLVFSPSGVYKYSLLTEDDGLEEPWLITFDEDSLLYIKEAGKDIKIFQIH